MRQLASLTIKLPSDFNPRIPQGMRQHLLRTKHLILVFQSTHSAGNATVIIAFYNSSIKISIHAFRRECDRIAFCNINVMQKFQSTHSAGNATKWRLKLQQSYGISIHAFRRECDTIIAYVRGSNKYFNPRIPQGMRLRYSSFFPIGVISIHAFRRECDTQNPDNFGVQHISIHAFRRECDGIT